MALQPSSNLSCLSIPAEAVQASEDLLGAFRYIKKKSRARQGLAEPFLEATDHLAVGHTLSSRSAKSMHAISEAGREGGGILPCVSWHHVT